MFAYCNNNPVNMLDLSGTISWAIFGDNHLFNPNMLSDFGGSRSSCANGGVSTRGRDVTLKELDSSDPEVIFGNLEKYGMASYNGVPVFRGDLGLGGGFSFGFIVLDDDYSYNNTGLQVLNHEYGHRLHMDQIGVVNYAITSAVPSLLHAAMYNCGILDGHYYSLPWEYVADIYGGVQRIGYAEGARDKAHKFLIYTILVSTCTGGI